MVLLGNLTQGTPSWCSCARSKPPRYPEKRTQVGIETAEGEGEEEGYGDEF